MTIRFFHRSLTTGPLAVGLAVVMGFGSGHAAERQYIDQARDYQAKGQLSEAVVSLKNALSSNPESGGARWLLGELYLQQGNGASAEKEFTVALRLGVDRRSVLIGLAEAYLLQQRYRPILESLVVTEFPAGGERAKVLALRGDAYLGQNDPSKARAAFQDALAEQPQLPRALLGLSRAALLQTDYSQARHWIDAAVAATPKDPEVWLLDATYSLRLGRFEASEKAFRKALALDKRSFRARIGVVEALFGQGKLKPAEQALEALAKADQGRVQTLYFRALLAYQRGDYHLAKEQLETLSEADAGDDRLPLLSGWTEYALGHLEQADYHARRLLARQPGFLPARRLKATIQLHWSRPDEAAALLAALFPDEANGQVAVTALVGLAPPDLEAITTITLLESLVVDEKPLTPPAREAMALLRAGNGGAAREAFATAMAEAEGPTLERIRSIEKQLATRQYDEALDAARALTQDFPGNAMALNLLAGAHLGRAEVAAARRYLEEALAHRPDSALVGLNLARLEHGQGNPRRARAVYLAILTQHPEHLTALLKLADLDSGMGRADDARGWWALALQAHPDSDEARIGLARAWLRAGQPERALAVIVSIGQSDSPAVLEVVGNARLLTGDAVGAVATLERLVHLGAPSAHIQRLLAQAYQETGATDQALRALNKALVLDPRHLPSRLSLARLYLLQGNTAGLQDEVARLKKAHSRDPNVIELEGQVALLRGRSAEALQLYRQALKRFGNRVWLLRLADAEWQVGDREGLPLILEQWLQEHPDDLPVRLRLAQTYLMLNRLDGAENTYAGVLEQDPNHVEALTNFAWLIREREPDKALLYAERAVARAPEAAGPRVYLGLILLQRGPSERALELIESAASKAPEDLNIRYQLAFAKARNGNTAEAKQLLESLAAEPRPFHQRRAAETLLEELGN